MDKDKRELRMFKEMYLADGELHQEKGHRKKNFRWKYLNGMFSFTKKQELIL